MAVVGGDFAGRVKHTISGPLWDAIDKLTCQLKQESQITTLCIRDEFRRSDSVCAELHLVSCGLAMYSPIGGSRIDQPDHVFLRLMDVRTRHWPNAYGVRAGRRAQCDRYGKLSGDPTK